MTNQVIYKQSTLTMSLSVQKSERVAFEQYKLTPRRLACAFHIHSLEGIIANFST